MTKQGWLFRLVPSSVVCEVGRSSNVLTIELPRRQIGFGPFADPFLVLRAGVSIKNLNQRTRETHVSHTYNTPSNVKRVNEQSLFIFSSDRQTAAGSLCRLKK